MGLVVVAGVLGCGPEVVGIGEDAGTSSSSGGGEGSSSVTSAAESSLGPVPGSSSGPGSSSSEDEGSTSIDLTSDASSSSSSEVGTSSSSGSTGCSTICEPHDCAVPSEYATIQSAIDDPLCAVINVAEGAYVENLTIARDVEIIGAPDWASSLYGDLKERLITIVEGTVRLENLHLMNPNDGVGEGCIENYGDLTIAHGYIGKWRRVGGEGAAIRSHGPLTLVDMQVVANEIVTDNDLLAPQTIQGAAIYIESAPLVIQSSDVSWNYASLGGTGTTILGGIVSAVDSDVVIEDSELEVENAGGGSEESDVIRGGTLYVVDGSLQVARTLVTGSIAPGPSDARGGTIYAGDSDVVLEASTLQGYAAGDDVSRGGSLHIEASLVVHVEIERTFIDGHVRSETTARGGSISASASNGGEIEIAVVNSWLRGIAPLIGADAQGAALFAEATDGSTIAVTLANTTWTGYEYFDDPSSVALSASTDASSDVTITVQNSIFRRDDASTSADCQLDGAVLVSNGHNLWSAPDSCSDAAAGDLAGDALFTEGFGAYLTPESPAIDAGDPSGCTDTTGLALTVDLYGDPRPVGAACDIGATEFQG